MHANEALYLAPETLYRIGNATSPLLTKIRPGELDIVEMNGVNLIVANGKGISLYNKTGLDLAQLSGWVWEIQASTPLPPGLKLIRDNSPEGHYSLCPTKNMTAHEFIGLLESIVIYCKKVFKKTA